MTPDHAQSPPQVWRGLSGQPPPEQGPLDVPFDQYQRYRVTADLAGVAAAGGQDGRLRVLDVGGHHADFWGRVRRPIADFLPACDTVTLDVAANPLRGYVRGRGDALPFRADSFDLVCSVDVLEHVPPTARRQLVDELHRVSDRAIVLAAPFRSPLVARAEAFVSDFIQRTCGYTQGQLQEHRELGWPDLAETAADLSQNAWHVRIFPYGNLWRWMLMMIDKHAVSAIAGGRELQSHLDRQYNETWFAHDIDASPAYRHFLVAARDATDPVLIAAEERFHAKNPQDLELKPATEPKPEPETAAEAERLFALLAIHSQNQILQVQLEPARRATHVAELEALRAELYKNLDALTRENSRLIAMLREIERSTPYRALAALKRLLPSGR